MYNFIIHRNYNYLSCNHLSSEYSTGYFKLRRILRGDILPSLTKHNSMLVRPWKVFRTAPNATAAISCNARLIVQYPYRRCYVIDGESASSRTAVSA